MFYLKEKNIVINEYYPCPCCGNTVNTADYIYHDSSQVEESYIFKCSNCTSRFARPILISELEDRQMDSLDDAEMYGSQIMKTLHKKIYIMKEIRFVQKAGLAGRNLLDVGCGAGWISNIWAQNGFQVTGLEPSLSRCNFAREKYGLNVVNEYVENTDFDQCFDVSILRHVIEHFQDPGAVLRKIHQTLNREGVVMVIVPNIDSIGRYLFGVNWEWVLPWHCNFFNKCSLETLLKESGFEVIKTYQTASPFYYFESMARKFDSKWLYSFNNRFKVASMLTTAPVALVGCALGLGDNLTAIARVRK